MSWQSKHLIVILNNVRKHDYKGSAIFFSKLCNFSWALSVLQFEQILGLRISIKVRVTSSDPDIQDWTKVVLFDWYQLYDHVVFYELLLYE